MTDSTLFCCNWICLYLYFFIVFINVLTNWQTKHFDSWKKRVDIFFCILIQYI